MSFNFKTYFELLFEKKTEEARAYKNQNVPQRIYKYVSLSGTKCDQDESGCGRLLRLNESKLNALRQNKIWMSRFDNLNDPFEYKAMFIDTEKFDGTNWRVEDVDEYLNLMRNSYVISSFTSNVTNNMPMWAHYANNHQGFCIEYSVRKPSFLFPVSYEDERVPVASILTNLISLIWKVDSGEIDTSDKDFLFYLSLVNHMGIIKHKSWSYENEVRIFFPHPIPNTPKGDLVPLELIGLEVTGIYLGSTCSKENQMLIDDISQSLNVPTYQMKLREDNTKYELEPELI